MTPKNNAASIHQRLLNSANLENRPFNELLQYYANERFLYRLGESQYFSRFVLKGALAFLVWQAPLTRPTRDIDFLGFTDNSVENMVKIVQDVCNQLVEADGITFDPTSTEGEIIKEGANYQGVRINFKGFLGRSQIFMSLDVGFADVVTPPPHEMELPTILENMSSPHLRVYPPETVIAEKFQTMIALGMVNSRMKDFYDIWFMAKSMEFDYNLLFEAISNTFLQRGTDLPKETPTAFTIEFANNKQSMWERFLIKNQIRIAPENLLVAIQKLKEFFNPMINPIEKQHSRWLPKTGWR